VTSAAATPDQPADGGLTFAGGRPASTTGQVAWTFFEFAGGPYFVVLQIFVFASYFANVIVIDDPAKGQAYWGYTGGIAGLLVALCSPVTGAIADRYGPRKPGILLFTLLPIPFMLGLWFAGPGDHLQASLCIIFASLLFELAFIFHNAMLPAIAPANRVGVLSAGGYAMSYLGAMVAFGAWFALPLLGLGGDAAHDYAQERGTGPLAALFAIVFVLPLMLLTPDTPRTGLSLGSCIHLGFRSLGGTLRKVGAYRNIVLFLIARMIYYDGLTAVFAFVGIYAANQFGWVEEVPIYGLMIIVTAAGSAVIGGMIDDRIGSKKTILTSLVVFSFCLALNLGTGPDRLWYFIALSPADAAGQLPVLGALLSPLGFDILPEQIFVVLGIVGGLFIGPALSSSRTMMARLAPPAQVAEFFGLYNLTGRATAFLAPLTIGVITQVTNDTRAGLGVIFVFIAIGFVLLCFVKEPRRPASP
jgi:UMF1 family MFS transporter